MSYPHVADGVVVGAGFGLAFVAVYYVLRAAARYAARRIAAK